MNTDKIYFLMQHLRLATPVGCVISESTASSPKFSVRYGLRLAHPTGLV
ncbi:MULTISPECIES: hypothetical protein [Nostocaceae]|nr:MULTISPECIES: hypothetical protein [Nostocaceae]MBD2474029.1 hypothetical protein [Anabaena sp. FACHB-83]